jgi:protein involved in polysaccharide export with SLBB domain
METQRMARIALGFVLVLLSIGTPALGQDYIVGEEDLLDISFWQEPNLNTQVKVGADGKISLDIIGQIEASGKTCEQLQNDIVREISRLNKNISQATVRVIEYNYNFIFVIGQVNQPGKKTFEQIPDLWTIINEAGGLTQSGDLSRVTIIRGGDQSGKIEVVNLAEALATGKLDQLPKLRRQDTIEIGRAPGQVMAGEVGTQTEKKNLIYVLGAVGTPGPVAYSENIDVMEALALAGGPTDVADLKHSHLVLKDGNYAQTIQFNLDKYVHSGRPARYIMQKEDLVYIPATRPGFFDTRLGQVATLMTALSTMYLLYDRIKNPN